MLPIPPVRNQTRSSNVYTINVPENFKSAVLKKSRTFGGASEIITLSLDDLAIRFRQMKNKMDIVTELNDYIKLEILLMRRYEEESKAKKDSKLSFRIKNHMSVESLNIIKKKTGWSTSKSVRVALLWYLYTNFDEFVASESFIPLLRCKHCGFVTHDQRALGVHIQTLHEKTCPYCGKHYPLTESHLCSQMVTAGVEVGDIGQVPSQTTIDQFTSIPLADIELDETKLLQELGMNDLGTLKPSDDQSTDVSKLIPDKTVFDESEQQLVSIKDEISKVGGTLVDLPDGDELSSATDDKETRKKSKKGKDETIDKLQSEISEILESLREDGLLE
ncbi:MAG: hypothetical protein H7647_03320 [Candidatus Heimdallarchaeota archaeon]|nr:hypothetical protein [Candidatus Heimdallarchaeota archaeon]MCK4253458.1 hypothetical protein [Candidatus Heimdallarchaeota archaeon]